MLVSGCVLLPIDAIPPAELVFSLVPVAPSVLLVAVVVAALAAMAGGLDEGVGTLPGPPGGGTAGCPPPGNIRAVEPTDYYNLFS